jgi:hypothetical protein
MLTYADLSDDMLFGDMDVVSDAAGAYVSIRQHTSAYVIRQHMSAYVSIRDMDAVSDAAGLAYCLFKRVCLICP